METSVGHMHRKQKLFLQNRDSDNGQRLRQLSQIEDIPCWSETQRNSNGNQVENSMDNGSSKLDFITSKEIPIEIGMEQLAKADVNISAVLQEKENDAAIIKFQQPRSSSCSFYEDQTHPQQKRNREKSEKNLSIKLANNDLDIEQIHSGCPSNPAITSQKIGNFKRKGVNGGSLNLKIMLKLKQKMSYFYRNFTVLGRTKQLNTLIRYYIGDKSDNFESSNRFSAFFLNNYLLYNIQRALKHINLPLIDCQSNFGMTISLAFIFYNCISMLIYSLYLVFSGFEDEYPLFCFITSLVWALEIIIKLNTSIFMKSKIIVERQKLITVYMKNKFIFDLFPLVIIATQSLNIYLQLLTLLKIFNMVSDLSQFQKYLCRVIKKYYFVILINLILKMFVFAHLIASVWYLIALIENKYLGIDSWIQSSIGVDGVWWKLYFNALYWALTLMTTGSNVASTSFQIIFTSIIMIFTTIAFGYLLNIVGFILETIDEQDDKKRRDINVINEFMRNKHISQSLQAQINLNLEHYYEMDLNRSQTQSQEVLEKISNELKNSLFKEYYIKIINKIPFLRDNFSQETLDKLSLAAKEQFYLPNQMIYDFNSDQEASFIYLISGSAEIVNSSEGSQFSTNKIKQGEIIGQYSFFTGMHQKLYIRSTEFTQIFRLSNADMISIIQSNDKDFETFCQIKDSLLMYEQYQNISLQCKVCGSQTHMIFDCPKLHIERQLLCTKIGLSQQQEQSRKERERRVKYQKCKVFNEQDTQIQLLRESYYLNLIQQQSSSARTFFNFEDFTDNEDKESNDQVSSTGEEKTEKFTIKEEEEEDDSNKFESSPVKNEIPSLLPTNMNYCHPIQKRFIKNCSSVQQFEDNEIFSPIIKNTSHDGSVQHSIYHSRDAYKQLKIMTNRGNENIHDSQDQDVLVRFVGSEYDQQSSQQKKSFTRFYSKNQNTNHSIQSGLNFDFEENKQKNLKKSEKKSPTLQQQRRQTVVNSSQIIKFHQVQQDKFNIEHEKLLSNPWTFEMLKDFNYYFKDGNSKKQISRHNKFIYKRIKSAKQRSPYRKIKID